MNINNWGEKIVDYVEGNLSVEDQKMFEASIEKSPELKAELEEYVSMLNEIDSLPEYNPTPSMDTRFQSLLIEEKRKLDSPPASTHTLNYKMLFQGAAAAIILLLGVFIGSKYCNKPTAQSEEIQKVYAQLEENKRMMLALLKEQSTSSRMTAVSYSYQMTNADDEIYDALITALNTDKSTNVRLAAMEGLAKFADNSKVRKALIQSLSIQTEAIVQISLINILVSLNEKSAIPEMEKIINDSNTLDKVKDEARFGIIKMS